MQLQNKHSNSTNNGLRCKNIDFFLNEGREGEGKEGERKKRRGRRKRRRRGNEGKNFTPSSHFAFLQIEKRKVERELTTCTSFIASLSGLFFLGTGLKPCSVCYEIVALDTNHTVLAAC